jgi:succinoglycan biosynthesis protein ExoM
VSTLPHITVCICTFRRAEWLRRLLMEVARQETDGRFTRSVVVADNDSEGSASAVVNEVASATNCTITYTVEPRQNISLARNAALAKADGDYVAFIDDDEIPPTNWLLTLFLAREHYQADGVLGPVKPRFEETPPAWVAKGGFYDRPSYPTGLVIDWRKGRTGNVLLKRSILTPGEAAFRSEFLTGEDQDFFRRMIGKGHVFVWCDEAMAHEIVPPVRWKVSFMLRRALLRGKVSLQHPTTGFIEVAKSFLAVPAYALMLPLLFCAGRHHFMRFLVKICDHLGRIMAALGWGRGEGKYVTE